MRESLLKLIGVVVALALSAHAFAVGMGGINVTSALGQPLKADIELVSVSKTEKASLVARIASPDVYKGAGLEYPYGNKFKFQVESRANGDAYLRVSSAQPVSDPFVSLLVELTWSSGKLLREYTFLLDPPGYVPEQAKQAEVQAVAPAVQAAAPAAQAVPAEVKPVEQAAAVVESKPAAQPVEEKAAEKPTEKQAEEKPAEKQAEQPVMAASAKRTAAQPAKKDFSVSSITVQRGDTLNSIAEQNRPSDVSLERMLVALYRANANQFDGKNMNRISTGKILRMPEQNELTGVSQGAAVKEIHAQVADWNAYRQKLAGAASASSQPQAAQQVSSGKITSTVADKAPVAKESAKEVLKLSKGEAPGDKTGATGKGMSAQDKKNAAQEDVIAKAKALKEEQGRAALLEKNLKDMQRLAELKAQAAALTLAASKPSSAVPAASSVAAASQVAASSSVAAASAVKPAPVAKPKPVVVQAPSLADQILGEPLYLAGGAAVLLGIGGLGFMVYRRRKSAVAGESHFAEDTGSTTGHMATPVAPSPETGDFTAAAASEAAVEEPEEVDPISEADLFLNFGRDAQAEEILKEALQNTPSDHRIHLKLLGIYAKRQDVKSFAELAGGLQDSGDDEAWQQAAEMGRKLDPNNPMYGGAATIEDADSATMQTTALNAIPDVLEETHAPYSSAAELDLDLGASSAVASPEQDFMESAEQRTMVLSPEAMAAVKAETMDFDVTSTNPSLTAPTSMDFDITSTSQSMPAAAESAALPDLDDLIFDVTSAQPSKPVEPASKPAPADDGGMEFTLDFPIGEAAEKPAAQPAEIGLSDISLNLDDISTPAEAPASAVKDEHWHEVATKLDLAKAYQEMGDQTGAREILDEVMLEGDAEQRETAQSLLNQLG